MPKIDEFQLQRAICIWLDGQPERAARPGARYRQAVPGALRPGVVYWHTPNGGKRAAFEAKRLKEMGVKAGVHDLLFLWGGLYGVECKDPDGGRLSPAQLAMHPRLLAAGMVASVVVDNLVDAKAFLVKHGLAVDSKHAP